MRTYSDDEAASERRILLQRNFRSRHDILDATNRVFRKTMRKEVTELDYLPEDELISVRENGVYAAVEVHQVLYRGDDKVTKKDTFYYCAEVAARRIEELVSRETIDGNPIRYKDIVILMPAVAGYGEKLEKVLTEKGIPVFFDGNGTFFEIPEVVHMMNILRVIDNVRQDVPLLGVMKGEPFCFTDEELAQIRLQNKDGEYFYQAVMDCSGKETPLGHKCRAMLNRIGEWRLVADVKSITDLIFYLFKETGIYTTCGAKKEGKARQANLMMLSQKAGEYEDSFGGSLHDFIRNIDDLKSVGDKTSAKTVGEEDNLVRIMTMHKSKGLEFPVVILFDIDKGINRAQKTGLYLHNKLGITCQYMNRRMNIRRPSLMVNAFKLQLAMDERAERARLFYVAMTRARDKLVMIHSKADENDWHMDFSAYRIMMADSMADWLMQAVNDDEQLDSVAIYQSQFGENGTEFAGANMVSTTFQQLGTLWKSRVWGVIDRENVENISVFNKQTEFIHSLLKTNPDEVLAEQLAHVYDRPEPKPSKTSVTAIVRQKREQNRLPITEDEETMEIKAREHPTQMLLSEEP
ncbi:MAG: 3'-5' exonuclease [Clostridia bacterium]|nr:3'-5' exonuclease [Clostridia bacterium]